MAEDIDEYALKTTTVAELIAKLQALPQDAEVAYLYDGSCLIPPTNAWLANGGHVVLCGDSQVVYGDADRPADAPTREQDRYWHTPPDEE